MIAVLSFSACRVRVAVKQNLAGILERINVWQSGGLVVGHVSSHLLVALAIRLAGAFRLPHLASFCLVGLLLTRLPGGSTVRGRNCRNDAANRFGAIWQVSLLAAV